MSSPEPSSPAPADASPHGGRRWPHPLAWVLLGCTGLMFWPMTRWVMAETVERDQIRQGAVLLLAAAVLAVWRLRGEL